MRFNAVTETCSPRYIREVKIQFPDNLFNLASTLGEKLWSSFFSKKYSENAGTEDLSQFTGGNMDKAQLIVSKRDKLCFIGYCSVKIDTQSYSLF